MLKWKNAQKVLEESSLNSIVKYINDGNCRNIITLAGAGISTSAGIPDLKTPPKGLYYILDKYKLPHPHAIFEVNYFKKNPKPFFKLAKEIFYGDFKPTSCHYFIKLLHRKGLLLRHYTQNVDCLERLAGLPDEKLVEAHGSIHTSHCIECGKLYSMEWTKEYVLNDQIPMCLDCSGLVKPSMVFLGENLPSKVFEMAKHDFKKCDLLLVMGTSLTMYPFSFLIHRVNTTCPRVLLNSEKVGHQGYLKQLITGSSESHFVWLGDFKQGCQLMRTFTEFDFDSQDNERDVLLLMSCDTGCNMLIQYLN